MKFAREQMEKWIQEKGDPWLYHHLADPGHLDSVLATGLHPGDDGHWPHAHLPREGCVYMSVDLRGDHHLRINLSKLVPSLLRVDKDRPRQSPLAFGPKWVEAIKLPQAPRQMTGEDGDPHLLEAGVWADTHGDDSADCILESLRQGSVAHAGTVLPDAIGINPCAHEEYIPERFHDRLLSKPDRWSKLKAAKPALDERVARRRRKFSESREAGLVSTSPEWKAPRPTDAHP